MVGYSFLRRPYPEVTGTISVAGMSQPVTVLRDESGVPHLFGDSLTDLARAQGFVHAQDRFFEMDVRRRSASGTLAALVGAAALDGDRVIRTLGWRQVAEKALPDLKPQTRQVLQAYADGVNSYLRGRSRSDIAIEYTLLSASVPVGPVPEWSPVDSLVWLTAVAWDLRANYRDELTRARLSGRMPRSQILEIFPAYPTEEHPPILAAEDWSPTRDTTTMLRGPGSDLVKDLASGYAQRSLSAAEQALARVPELVGNGSDVGSNSWVVGPTRSSTGKPLLANDPHLATSQPGIWVQNSLHCRARSAQCPLSVSGFSFAGVPGVVIGHNQAIAWGMTNLAPDVTDFYLERINGDTYDRSGVWKQLEFRQEIIEVAGGDPVEMTVRSTVHGPILSDVLPAVADAGAHASTAESENPSEAFAVSLAWTGLTPTKTADAIVDLNLATTFEQFRAAARSFAVPAQNLVYADVNGHIGYQAPGLIPIRRPAIAKSAPGFWPAPGWDPAYDWQGFVPFADMPWALDPPGGVIVAANQQVTAATRPYLTTEWDYGFRSARIRELLGETGTLTPAQLAAMQQDSVDLFAKHLVPTLLTVPLGDDAFTREARDLLLDWDFTTPASHTGPDGERTSASSAAAYFGAVWHQLLDLTFNDELPSGVTADGSSRWRGAALALLATPTSAWWDDQRTAGVVETRDEILRRALVGARLELTRKLGKDPGQWEWGRLHAMTLRHKVLGGESVPGAVRWLVNSGPHDVGGGSAIVNATSWDASSGYAVVSAPSMRMVANLADLDASTWINLTGSSGHPLHPHYDDQVGDWLAGVQRPWPFTEAAVRSQDVDELTLQPAP